jgi:hypothetical protein
MSEPLKNPFDLLLDQIRQVVAEEIAKALQNGGGHAQEKGDYLTPEQAAKMRVFAKGDLCDYCKKVEAILVIKKGFEPEILACGRCAIESETDSRLKRSIRLTVEKLERAGKNERARKR